jgi:broad specificity phosphatase PhoE
MMTTFLLIRHGFTDVIGNTIVGRLPGIHLNERGRVQARRLSQALAGSRLDAVYTSPLERARETAGAIAEPHGLAPETMESIGELDAGDWAGTALDALNRDERWRSWNTWRSGNRAPAGESMLDVQRRMADEMIRLRAVHPEATLALVSHGDPIRAALAYFLGISLDLCLRLEVSPASVSIVRLAEWGPQIAGIGLRADGFALLPITTSHSPS